MFHLRARARERGGAERAENNSTANALAFDRTGKFKRHRQRICDGDFPGNRIPIHVAVENLRRIAFGRLASRERGPLRFNGQCRLTLTHGR